MNRNPKRSAALGVLLASALLAGIAGMAGTAAAQSPAPRPRPNPPAVKTDKAALAKATFAGGCFWCMEPPFDKIDGVVSTTSGYAGGPEKNPTYEQVSAGETGHAEVVQVVYDPAKVSYEKLLQVFWHNVDPTTPERQFCDRGKQYRTAIYYHDPEQKRLADASKRTIAASAKLPGPIVTEIAPLTAFYPAEEYHQDFYVKSPVRYKTYRAGCGRDRRLEDLWGEQAGH
ncbi:MAG TPA: peptide-methionine (S)-S-oxide reductase MsrA [Thermoanaerobaculia bacterium]|nr:peptide-methionine (S)-S-oxide reductase MsrA [Thermoanaerobaculia bacterium]